MAEAREHSELQTNVYMRCPGRARDLTLKVCPIAHTRSLFMCSTDIAPKSPSQPKATGFTKPVSWFQVNQKYCSFHQSNPKSSRKQVKTYVTCSIELWLLKITKKWEEMVSSDLKSRDITLPTKVHIVQARCESWTIKKTELRRIDAFKLWC